MSLDRFKEAFAALVRAGVPGIDYLTTYRARVVSQSSDGARVDVQPDDARLPSMSNLRLKLGIPGASVQLNMDTPSFVQIAWENGDPTKPFASLFEGGATVVKLSVSASSIVLDGSVFAGGEPGASAGIMADQYRPAEDTFLDAICVGVSAALTGLGLGSAASTLAAAQSAFHLAATTYLTTKAKVV